MPPARALPIAARRWLTAVAALVVTALAAGGSFALGALGALVPEGELSEGSLAPEPEVRANGADG